MFRITGGKGFRIKFKNGITISTQFGYGNYCDNHSKTEFTGLDVKCADCEVAIWDETEDWITGQILNTLGIDNDGSVAGRINPDQWADIVEKCKKYKES